MFDAPVSGYIRRAGSAVLSASIIAALLISAGLTATLILFAPVASAQTGPRTLNAEYTVSIDYWLVETDQS